MIPLTVNPRIVIEVRDGVIRSIATNIAPDVQVTIVETPEDFLEQARGQSFVETVN
jgi:hypothetical protein